MWLRSKTRSKSSVESSLCWRDVEANWQTSSATSTTSQTFISRSSKTPRNYFCVSWTVARNRNAWECLYSARMWNNQNMKCVAPLTQELIFKISRIIASAFLETDLFCSPRHGLELPLPLVRRNEMVIARVAYGHENSFRWRYLHILCRTNNSKNIHRTRCMCHVKEKECLAEAKSVM